MFSRRSRLSAGIRPDAEVRPNAEIPARTQMSGSSEEIRPNAEIPARRPLKSSSSEEMSGSSAEVRPNAEIPPRLTMVGSSAEVRFGSSAEVRVGSSAEVRPNAEILMDGSSAEVRPNAEILMDGSSAEVRPNAEIPAILTMPGSSAEFCPNAEIHARRPKIAEIRDNEAQQKKMAKSSSISVKDRVDDHVSISVDTVASTAKPAFPYWIPGSQTTMRVQNVRDPIAFTIMGEVTKKPTFWPDCCIYKVPKRLCKGYEDFYTPRVVSIGPYHYCNGGSLEVMQAHKFRYLEAFFSRNNLNLDHCVGVVRELEGKARRYYVEPVKLDSDKFAQMLLVDGAFLLELMLRHYFGGIVDDCDRIYHKPRVIQDVYRDLLLIENQIPFFILEALYKELDRRNGIPQLSLVEITREFFIKYLGKSDEFLHDPIVSRVQHFVDFIRWYYLPKCESKSDIKSDNGIIFDVPSVTAMDEAGVKFEEGTKLNALLDSKSDNKSDNGIIFDVPTVTAMDEAGVKFVEGTKVNALLDMEFTHGSLQIRHFVVDDWTETIFRNLIAFEQCHDHKVKYISQFMFLMGCMIRTPKDADLLVDQEIISSRLGNSKDISTIFNNICKGVGLGGPFYYFTLCNNLKAYCRSRSNRWKAILKRDYFNTPWKLVSTIAAVALLVLTVIQAVCSIISVS